MPEVGDSAPDFRVATTAGEVARDDLLAGGKLVLAFYTEDNTPACSSELSMLRNDYDLIREMGATVLAISTDSADSHRDFAQRLGGVPFPLGTDETLVMARAYGVADEEAKRCRRAIFVIAQDGRILHAEPWFQPGNPAHYEAIFRALGFDE
jgi:peroxiredoxin Q/BCP